jgi:hypothetical protein
MERPRRQFGFGLICSVLWLNSPGNRQCLVNAASHRPDISAPVPGTEQ